MVSSMQPPAYYSSSFMLLTMVDRALVMSLVYEGNLRIIRALMSGFMFRSCLSRCYGFDTNNITLIRHFDVKKPERGSCNHVMETLIKIVS